MFISVPDWIRIRPTVPDPDQGHKVTPTAENVFFIRFFVGTLMKTLAKYVRIVYISVVDPYSFFPDPDPNPEFAVGDQYGSGFGFRIRIQYGSRALMTKN